MRADEARPCAEAVGAAPEQPPIFESAGLEAAPDEGVGQQLDAGMVGCPEQAVTLGVVMSQQRGIGDPELGRKLLVELPAWSFVLVEDRHSGTGAGGRHGGR